MISLKRNFTWMFFGNLFYIFTQWAIITILAKLTNASLVGAYTYGLALSAPIMLFFNFQMRVIISTDSDESIKFQKYYSYRLTSMIIGVLIIILILNFINIESEVKLITLLITLNKAIEGLSEICYGYYQQKENMKFVSKSLILRGISSVIMIFLGIIITDSLIVSLILMNIIWLLIHILYELRILRNQFTVYKFIDFDINTFLKLLKIGLPMGFVVMLGSLNSNIPRYIIENQLTILELGVYGALTYILVGTGKFFSTITQVIAPRISRFYNSGLKKELIRIILGTLFLIIMFLVLILVITYNYGEQILTLLYAEEYSSYSKLFIEIMILGGFIYVGGLFGTILTAMKVYTLQVPIHLIKIVIVSIFTYIFMKDFGLSGSVYAMILSYIFSLILYGLIILKKIFKMNNIK